MSRRIQLLTACGSLIITSTTLGFNDSSNDILQPGLMQTAHVAANQNESIDLLIRFDHTPNAHDQQRLIQLGGTINYSFRIVPVIAASFDPDTLPAIIESPGVTLIEHDGQFQAFDDELDNSWGVKRIGGGFAHDQGFTGSRVRVAVLDTGIDYTHPELASIYMGGWDFVNNDADPMDDHDHGTHVSGTVAAAWDGTGVVGVAPDVELFGLKVLNHNGMGNFSAIIAALEWCIDNQIDVTNQSLGSFSNPGQSVEDAYNAGWDAGILHAAASGNFFGIFGVAWPARYDSVIAVGATDKDNKKAGFTDTGPQLELMAPGVDVNSCKRGGGYVIFSGTSMASPHVAGTAALCYVADIVDENGNGRINDEVRRRLADTAIDLGVIGRDNNYGFGLVNAQAAIKEPMVLTVDPLIRGESADMITEGASPRGIAYFVYTPYGTAPTPVNQLGVLMALNVPTLAAQGNVDANGQAVVTVDVPASAPLVTVWLQSVEPENSSQVVITEIQ